ncbi:hypothetical protein [Streptobacillus notomytis]|uniref:hypothetical protein n=1 Tax=Streptobacillus notomytis TaxID=1712031 RepID=UPI0015D67611|nr:hypothetical protein [Streptobacillus notomytis]
MKKIFLLTLIAISNTLLSSELFDFKNSRKVKVELEGVIQGNTFTGGHVGFKNEFSGSVKLYEFLKLSGGLGFGTDDALKKIEIKPSDTYLGLGLDFKEFGNLELKINQEKSLGLKYEYSNKWKHLDFNVKGSYNSFYAWHWGQQPGQREHRYELDTKLKYDIGRNFTLVSDLDLYLSMWYSGKGKRSVPYGLTVGAGIDYSNSILSGRDYKDNITSGVYINHYHKRNQDFPDEDGYETYSGYHKGFLFKAYVGYEFEKQLGENGMISILGKLTGDVDNQYFSRKEELDYNGAKKLYHIGYNLENRTHLHLYPQIKLGYKFNDNFSVYVDYSSVISFSKIGTYAGMRNKLRTGVKYTWEK